jgi:hypothetical protein
LPPEEIRHAALLGGNAKKRKGSRGLGARALVEKPTEQW